MEQLAYSRSRLAYGVVHRSRESDGHARAVCTGRIIINPRNVRSVDEAPSKRLCLLCERLRKSEE